MSASVVSIQRTLPKIALSVRQPWAWAIIHAGKDIENRGWKSVRLGSMEPKRIAVHAAKGMTRDEYEDAREFMERNGVECPRPDELVRGGIIGAVSVVAIVKEHASPWFFGPRGLVLIAPEACEPEPSMGSLGYFEWVSTMADDLDQPKPWMTSWPENPRAKRAPTPRPVSIQPDIFGGMK